MLALGGYDKIDYWVDADQFNPSAGAQGLTLPKWQKKMYLQWRYYMSNNICSVFKLHWLFICDIFWLFLFVDQGWSGFSQDHETPQVDWEAEKSEDTNYKGRCVTESEVKFTFEWKYFWGIWMNSLSLQKLFLMSVVFTLDLLWYRFFQDSSKVFNSQVPQTDREVPTGFRNKARAGDVDGDARDWKIHHGINQ